MTPLPLALCVFDSTLGHFGRRDIYQRSITDLAAKMPLECFKVRLAHIKVQEGEETVADQQVRFYQERGFEIITTEGEWSHFNVSHQQEYSKDLISVYGDPSVLSCEYALHLESDWGWSLNDGQELVDLMSRGIAHLAANPRLVGIRFPRFLNEVARLDNLLKKHGLNVRTARDGSFIRHNDNISLNPSLYRTRDLFLATRLMKQHFNQYGNHVEHQFGELLRWMSDGELPWAIYDPAQVSVLHLGTKPGDEDVAGNVWETITS